MFWQRKAMPQQVDFSGHFERTAFAIGDHAVANTYNGTVIQNFAPGAAPRPTRRPPPQRRPPRDPVELLGREVELARVDAALRSASAVAFHGSSGVGKTVLLKHVARQGGAGWPDGVLYANVGAQALEDVLQWLFTVFWDTGDVVYVPGALGVGEYLAGVRALVVLDDVDLTNADVERLLGGAPACAFAIGAAQPRLPEHSYALSGLNAAAARAVFTRVLGRDLADVEQPDVDEFVDRVGGLPGHVVTGAELVRDGVCSAGDLVEQAGRVLARRRIAALPAQQQELLGLLAELAPAPVPAARLGPGAEHDFERLREAAFVERHSPRYTLAGPLDADLARDLTHIGAAELLRRLAAEAQSIGADDAPAVVAALDWGRRAGEDEEVLRAARALAPAMVRSGRTGAWETVAALGLTAAQRLGRRADEALFLHEQGTRLGCLGDDAAWEPLTRARDIRRQLGDEDAAAVTEHNLRELFGGPGDLGGEGDDPGGGGGNGARRPPLRLFAAFVAPALIVVIALLMRGGDDLPSQTITTSLVPGAQDQTAPKITLTRPRHEDSFPAGARVVAAYECRDGGRPTPVCRGTVRSGTAINTTEGEHEFRIDARDRTGNVTTMTVTYRAEKGSVPPPEVIITSPADGKTYEAGTVIRARYRCPNASTCESRVPVGAGVDRRPGRHAFTVRATGAGGRSVEGTVTYTVRKSSAAGPSIVITSPADGTTYAAGTVIRARYECRHASTCKGGVPVGAGVDRRPGPHPFTVRATGADGTPVEETVIYTVEEENVDAPPPVTPPADPIVIDAKAVDRTLAGGIVTVEYECTGGTQPMSSCMATLDGKPFDSGARIGCGKHTLVVRAQDAAGQSKERTFSIDGRPCPEAPR